MEVSIVVRLEKSARDKVAHCDIFDFNFFFPIRLLVSTLTLLFIKDIAIIVYLIRSCYLKKKCKVKVRLRCQHYLIGSHSVL